VAEAARDAIAAGADFVKTSTGKGVGGATLGAAEAMLKEIRRAGGKVGFKASGGIRSVAEAAAYLALAERMLGSDWPTPERFRFGASSLLGDVLQQLGGDPRQDAGGDY
jgi:deoxyribose-phosphate aldolase